MRKIQPSERISNEIEDLLKNGLSTYEKNDESDDLIKLLFQKALRRFIQQTLEQEVKDYTGREHYQRRSGEQEELIYRNGYENKNLRTAEGKLAIEVPQLRNTATPYRSEFLDRLGSISPELEKLIREMYIRGLSTRDIEDTLRGEDGKLLISRTGVSELTQSLNQEYEMFRARDLSSYDVIYFFADGVYESLRMDSSIKEAILCAWAILSNGQKVMLHLALGNKESYECWKEFLRDMIRRGLRYPLLTTTDGAPGLIKAIEECFPESKRQKCLAHKMRNISNKLPEEGRAELMPRLRDIFNQTDKEIAMLISTKVIETYADKYPSAIKCFQDDLEHCLTFMQYPSVHQKYIRTTNLLERAFEEQRRRTKVIPRFFSESSCITLVYGTLIRVSEKWKKIKMTPYDLVVLRKMRTLYGWKEDKEGFISRKYAA